MPRIGPLPRTCPDLCNRGHLEQTFLPQAVLAVSDLLSLPDDALGTSFLCPASLPPHPAWARMGVGQPGSFLLSWRCCPDRCLHPQHPPPPPKWPGMETALLLNLCAGNRAPANEDTALRVPELSFPNCPRGCSFSIEPQGLKGFVAFKCWSEGLKVVLRLPCPICT